MCVVVCWIMLSRRFTLPRSGQRNAPRLESIRNASGVTPSWQYKTSEKEQSRGAPQVLVRFDALRPQDWASEDYRYYLPLLCETAAYLYRIGQNQFIHSDYYDWVLNLNPVLAREPLRQILEGQDVRLIASAAYYACVLNIQDTVPLLTDILTVRQRGKRVDDPVGQAYFRYPCIALGCFAARGNSDALNFMLPRTRPSAWQGIEFTALSLSRDESIQSMVWWTVEGLTYCPTDESIAAIAASSDVYDHWRDHIDLILAYRRTDDTLGQYHRELIVNKYLNNKYYHWPGLDKPSSVPRTRDVVRRIPWPGATRPAQEKAAPSTRPADATPTATRRE